MRQCQLFSDYLEPEDGSSRLLRNIDIAAYPRRLDFSSTPLCEPYISHYTSGLWNTR